VTGGGSAGMMNIRIITRGHTTTRRKMMTRQLKYSLVILWRMSGEQTLNFSTKGEAEKHMNMLDAEKGHQIVKMEVTQIQ